MDLPIDVSQIGLRGQSAIGLVAFVFIAWLFSTGKGRFPFFAAVWTVGAQIAIAAFLLYFPPAREGLSSLRAAVEALQAATTVGTSF
ncbi:MAG: Na+ dependent nucleoside transporter N-terminal domain-containing protein, partial [Hyphococcus sp.]